MEIIKIKIEDLKPYKNNAKLHPEWQIEQIIKSIEQFGFNDPIAIWGEDNIIVEGHGRLEAVKKLGYTEVECIRLDHLTEEERKAYTLAHNKTTMNSDFDFDLLKLELDDIKGIDMSDFGFDILGGFDTPKACDDIKIGSLADRFGIPPFSVFDTKQGYWQERKNKWKALGIKSEIGRDENLLRFSEVAKAGMTGTSIFDPVLCEICYKWFNIENGKIYDPFAGGSVRGIVASKLGYDYQGIDLRKEQVESNKENAKELGLNPTWYCDDSNNVDNYIEDESIDLVFSCPPYVDLEVYSDDPRDLSNMDYEDFKNVYKSIITKACKKLKEDRFAIFVVGDVRDKNGFYINFVDETKKYFVDAGLKFYNEIILVNAVGSGALRAPKQFVGSRKVVKMHQNVLVFYKGNPKNIKENYKEIIVENIDELY